MRQVQANAWPWPQPAIKAWAPWLLAVPVLAAHLWLAAQWPDDRFGWGGDSRAPPARIDVAFVRELQPAPPASPPAAPPAEPRTRVLRAPWPAASAAAGVQPLPLDADAHDASVALPPVAGLPELAALPEPLPPLSPLPSLTSGAAGAFEWPPSTRLSYVLTGHYQGPVEGQAQVEWRLAGQRYQVALELGIGPPLAPLVTRQLLSDGLLTEAGLEPRRYDEETRIVLRAPRRLTITLDPDRVVLPSGRQVPRPPGVQDSASQFVQMTWMFTMQPQRLSPGQLLQLPLALPRHVEVWAYEVVGPERLHTPFGDVDAVHVRPQRLARSEGRGGDLSAEFWVAPTLQYLPVRILIRQDEQTYVDLMLRRLPQQALEPGQDPARRAAPASAQAPAAAPATAPAPATTR